jgi:scyllo-inositol 2-dehydrogenase (NADP+)
MEKIKAALLSYGMSGRVFHAPFLEAHDGFILAGAWERSAQLVQQHYPSTKSYPSLESVLQDNTIDLVVVNTPTYTHYEYAKQALLAGKHVVVEKAFTTTVAEAKEVTLLGKEQQKKLSVFQNRRWDSDFKTVQQIVNEGSLGAIVEATFSFDRYNPSLSAKQHKEIPGPGAGITKDLGPHLIDQALVLFGMPDALFADIRTTRIHSKVDDYFEIILYYPSFRVRLKAGYFVREATPAYVLHGTKGSFLKIRGDIQETSLQAGKKPSEADWGAEPESAQGLLHTEKEGKIIREPVKTHRGSYMEYYEGMYNAIAENKEVPVTGEDGIHVMQIIEAAFESSEAKKVIEFRTLSY